MVTERKLLDIGIVLVAVLLVSIVLNIYNEGPDTQDTVSAAIELLENAPQRAEILLPIAVQKCLEDEFGSALPDDLVQEQSLSYTHIFRFTAEHGKSGTLTPALVERMRTEYVQKYRAHRRSSSSKRSGSSNTDFEQTRVVLDWVIQNNKAYIQCVARKVLLIANNY